MLRSALGLLVGGLFVLSGCASPAALDLAAPSSPALSGTVSFAALVPAPQPDLPPALRPDGPSVVTTEAAPDHGAHGAMGMVPSHSHEMAPAPSSHLTAALDAYLAIQETLAVDETEGISDAARRLVASWALAVEEAPEADPHFWHARSAETAAVRTHALALAEAEDLVRAREAFGYLSASFVALLEAHGVPTGYDLVRFTCGMRSGLPEGGVWLQRGTQPRNPYFGSQMADCASGEGRALPSAGAPQEMQGMEHSTMGHGDHAAPMSGGMCSMCQRKRMSASDEGASTMACGGSGCCSGSEGGCCRSSGAEGGGCCSGDEGGGCCGGESGGMCSVGESGASGGMCGRMKSATGGSCSAPSDATMDHTGHDG